MDYKKKLSIFLVINFLAEYSYFDESPYELMFFHQNVDIQPNKKFVLKNIDFFVVHVPEALQERLNAIEKQAKDNAMCINVKKMSYNNFYFFKCKCSPSSLKLDNNIIQREKLIKLLGVIISDHLKWTQNTIS